MAITIITGIVMDGGITEGTNTSDFSGMTQKHGLVIVGSGSTPIPILAMGTMKYIIGYFGMGTVELKRIEDNPQG